VAPLQLADACVRLPLPVRQRRCQLRHALLELRHLLLLQGCRRAIALTKCVAACGRAPRGGGHLCGCLGSDARKLSLMIVTQGWCVSIRCNMKLQSTRRATTQHRATRTLQRTALDAHLYLLLQLRQLCSQLDGALLGLQQTSGCGMCVWRSSCCT
jgi:hypothetical protein